MLGHTWVPLAATAAAVFVVSFGTGPFELGARYTGADGDPVADVPGDPAGLVDAESGSTASRT